MSGFSTYSFHIHGIDLRVETDSPTLARGITELLEEFLRPPDINGNGFTLVCRIVEGNREANRRRECRSRDGRLYSSSRDDTFDLGTLGIKLDIYRDGRFLLWDFHHHGRLLLDPEQGTLEGCLTGPITLHHQLAGSLFFLAPFSRLLAGRGLYMIHAAALERKGCGVLIPGVRGSGKSTSCVALLRAGYRCLSDDKPFLRENGNGIELLAFPEKIDVTDQTISFFPELCATTATLTPGYRKRQFRSEAIYPGSTTNAARPRLILFPTISGESASWVERLPKAKALEAILPHSLLVFDRVISTDHFQLLGHLVAETDCYRLAFGRDILDLPALVDSLLE